MGREKKGDEGRVDGNYLHVARPGRRIQEPLEGAKIEAFISLKGRIYHRSVVTTT